ncbi:hypothetical protein ABHI18_003229 [Aspergillus niger]
MVDKGWLGEGQVDCEVGVDVDITKKLAPAYAVYQPVEKGRDEEAGREDEGLLAPAYAVCQPHEGTRGSVERDDEGRRRTKQREAIGTSLRRVPARRETTRGGGGRQTRRQGAIGTSLRRVPARQGDEEAGREDEGIPVPAYAVYHGGG